MTPTAATKPLEIQLLICPTCRKPSRVDAAAFHGSKGRAWCSGPIGEGHRKVKCESVRFREVGEK
jgi:hypothetical protein